MPLPDLAPLSTSAAVKEVLEAKYTDAGAWAVWAQQLLTQDIISIKNLLGIDKTQTSITTLLNAVFPTYSQSPAVTAGNAFATGNTALTALQSRITNEIGTYSTGLGATVETAMFARETARANTLRAAAYNEATTSFSSRGFDMPPGALLAKQTEMNNESALRLADSSTGILVESARLAADYNKHMLTLAIQLQSALATVFNSEQMLSFEASKTNANLAVEAFKTNVSVYAAKADLQTKQADMVLANAFRTLQLEVSTLAGLAQGATQLISGALNGVSVSTSFGFSGSSGYSKSESISQSATYPQTTGTAPPVLLS